MFSHIRGNDLIKTYLMTMLKNGAIGNSLLFAGPEGIGKSLFAEALATHLLGRDAKTHPDYHVYRPEGKIGMHSMQTMRQFSEEVYMAPFQGKWKIFVIHDAERMLSYSANALLKTFEEPAKDSIIILLSSEPQTLLPTVLSRCRTIRFHDIEKEEAPCPVREATLALLQKGPFVTYSELIQAAKSLAELVEESKTSEEAEIRSDTEKLGFKEMTAVQKEALEKEIEGALAMKLARHADQIFQTILAWHRDAQLVACGGDSRLLLLHCQSHAILSIEEVEKAIKSAQTSIERSTSLHIVLERLFLQLF